MTTNGKAINMKRKNIDLKKTLKKEDFTEMNITTEMTTITEMLTKAMVIETIITIRSHIEEMNRPNAEIANKRVIL